MRIEINCEDIDSSDATKSIINKILDIVDNHPTKEKEHVHKEIMRTDEILVPVFLSLIKKNAIICYEKTIKGKSKTLLKTENRNSIFYAISRLKDIFTEETLRTWFEYSFFNGDKKEPKAFNRLKPLDVNEAFELYLKGDFSDFCSITDYCCALYKKYEERKSRMSVPNPIPVVKNVIYQPYCKMVHENKLDETVINNDTNKQDNGLNNELCQETTEVEVMNKEETKQEESVKKIKKTTTKQKTDKKQAKSSSSKPKKESNKKQSIQKTSKQLSSKKSDKPKETVKSNSSSTSKKTTSSKQCKTEKTKQKQCVSILKKTVKQTNTVNQKTTKEQAVKQTNIKVKSLKNTSRQKLNDINVKLSKSFFEFIKISQEFVDIYAKQNEEVPFDVLLNNVKNNESYVDKIRKELKKLSTVKKRIMNIKNDEK